MLLSLNGPSETPSIERPGVVLVDTLLERVSLGQHFRQSSPYKKKMPLAPPAFSVLLDDTFVVIILVWIDVSDVYFDYLWSIPMTIEKMTLPQFQ